MLLVPMVKCSNQHERKNFLYIWNWQAAFGATQRVCLLKNGDFQPSFPNACCCSISPNSMYHMCTLLYTWYYYGEWQGVATLWRVRKETSNLKVNKEKIRWSNAYFFLVSIRMKKSSTPLVIISIFSINCEALSMLIKKNYQYSCC